MLDKGLINVLAEILDQPAEKVSEYFTSNISRSNNSKPEEIIKAKTSWATSEAKIEKTLIEIQKTLEEDAHQRHALELQLKAINERIDKLERKNNTSCAQGIEDIKDFLQDVRNDLEKEKVELLSKKNPTVEEFSQQYRCCIQLDLIEEILNFILHE